MEICCRNDCPNASEPTSAIKVSGFRQVHSAPTKGETFHRQKTAHLRQLSDNIASNPHTRREAVEMGPTE